MMAESKRVESRLLYFCTVGVVSQEKYEMIIENEGDEQILASD